MSESDFKVLILGRLPEADELFERDVLKHHFSCEVKRVEDPEDFAEAVHDPSADLILIDVEPHGVKVLQTVLDERPMRPMIMVADADHGDVILKAKRMGLERYVMRLSDPVLNTDLLVEEIVFVLQQLAEPPSMEHPTVEQLFRFAQYHNVRQPFFVIDRNHCLLYANASGKSLVEDVHDYQPREGDDYERFPLTGSSQDALAHRGDALDGNEVEVECTYEQLPAEDRHREVLYQPVRDNSDQVVGVSIACKNIGVRRQIQDRLQRQQEALWSFFELVPLPLKIIDRELTIRRANPALADLVGYDDPDDLEGVALEDLLDPDDYDVARNMLSDLFDGAAPYSHFECRYQRRDGETVWTNHVDFPLRGIGSNESPPLVLVLSADITRQKEAEQREAQSMRMRAIGELSAGVAHDFNNVLSIVTTYSQLLEAKLQAQNDTEMAGYTQKILGAVERAMALTRQLLTFGQEDPGAATTLDLNRRIREASSLLERNLGGDIDIQCELAADLPAIEADPSQLDQVIMNLTINARDAMYDGGTLRLSTRRESIDGDQPARPDLLANDYAVLEVSDTGQGMDEQTQRHIFEPFFTTKGPSQGTGLGLATVYRIVDRSGGRIYVDSEPGEGTTFTVYFPASDAPPANQRSE